ncbi:MAG: hypothetical protein K1X52_13635 [Pyrinomonadaceae bacterium]|nr:hypothetical protein [Pyrinomonadaceae bacterium]
MYTLEKYGGKGTRHTCPACGTKRRFTRYVDVDTGQRVADDVGRCDRESKCGYHRTPKEHFAEEHAFRPSFRSKVLRQAKRPFEAFNGTQTQRIGYLERTVMLDTLTGYDQNDLVQFLLCIFDHEAVKDAVRDYLIGTGRNGEAIYWQVDRKRRIRTGKAIKYDRRTGKRDKKSHPFWMHPKEGYNLRQCLFGEHLLAERPDVPIAIVESEKTAVVASIFKGVFPEMSWLATGGRSNLSVEKLKGLGSKRRIILFPDADSFEKWNDIALHARKNGQNISVSTLIERYAPRSEKAAGFDLADYLIREQKKQNNAEHLAARTEMIEERLAIMIFDGHLTEQEAKAALNLSRD